MDGRIKEKVRIGVKAWIVNKGWVLVNSAWLPNQSVHLTPEAGAFFVFAISEQNFVFIKSPLASGVGDFRRTPQLE